MIADPVKKILFWGIPLGIIIVGLAAFLLSGNNSTEASGFSKPKTGLSPELASFENNFYDYLSESIQELFISSGGNSSVLSSKIADLTGEGIKMIDEFIDQQKQEGKILTENDLNRLNQLRFYVYSSIAIDEGKTRGILNQLPNNPNKLSLLYTYIETFAKPDSRPDTSDASFDNFISDQRQWAKPLEENYAEKAALMKFKGNPIGTPLPNHLAKYKGTEGQELDLRNYRDKYVLIDFWATWCLPCIAELPYLQEAYQRFQSKGFEIISISLDNNRKALNDFISDRKITWPQYFDGKGFRSELVSAYGVTGIPTLYLVNREGNTISVNMRGEELIRILKEELGS